MGIIGHVDITPGTPAYQAAIMVEAPRREALLRRSTGTRICPPDWQRDEWEIAHQINSTECFKPLPTKFDVNECEIMHDFSRSVASDGIREELLRAIHGAGAFRNFKDTVRRLGVEPAWFAFRADVLRQIALDWCEENQIAWE